MLFSLPLAVFICIDVPCPCCPVTGSLTAPYRNHCDPDGPLYFLHLKGNLSLGTGLSLSPLPFRAAEPALDPGLQRHPVNLPHRCQAPRLVSDWPHQDRDEDNSSQSACALVQPIGMGYSGTFLHALLPWQQKLFPSAWCFEWANPPSTVTRRKQAGGKQKAWLGVVFLWMQNTPHEAWISGQVVSWLAGCLPSSSPPQRQQNCVK